MLKLIFLGTAAARPTIERNVSSIALVREGETLLFECGEGTQRQMMRYGVSFALSEIFFSHFHADHFLGVTGLVRTLGLQDRQEPIHLYGPPGAQRILARALELGQDRAPFAIEIHEVKPGDALERKGYDLETFPTEHGRHSLGFALREHPRLGQFNPEKARALGVPEGPLWGRLHAGERVRLDDGREIGPQDLVGPPRPGRLVVLTGDTSPSKRVVEVAQGADLLVHEATFSDEQRDRARETDHSTAKDAADVARAAKVRRLALTHVSARYSGNAEVLLEEARAVFPATVVARDGMTIEVPFAQSS